MHTAFVAASMGAEADAHCGAPHGQPSLGRTNQRDGHRQRELDSRAGTIDVAIPKLRSGSCFPDWLLERCRRADQDLTTRVWLTCYLLGVGIGASPASSRKRSARTCPGGSWQRSSVNIGDTGSSRWSIHPSLREDLRGVTQEVQRQTRPCPWWSFVAEFDAALAQHAAALPIALERAEGILVEHLQARGHMAFAVSPRIAARTRSAIALPRSRTTGSIRSLWPTPCAADIRTGRR